jgi:hypothetical protein
MFAGEDSLCVFSGAYRGCRAPGVRVEFERTPMRIQATVARGVLEVHDARPPVAVCDCRKPERHVSFSGQVLFLIVGVGPWLSTPAHVGVAYVHVFSVARASLHGVERDL